MPEKDSANVFLTKSFWLPLVTMLVSKATVTLQDWVVLSDTEQEALIGAATVAAIVIVRRFTSRPAHILKKKETSE